MASVRRPRLAETATAAHLKMLAMGTASALGALRGKTPFRSVAVETTTHCHRRCSYCPVAKSPKAVQYMDDAVFRQILSQLSALHFDGRFCYHHFNEPLLNRDLERLVQMASRALPNAAHAIYTSGDLLTEARYQSLREAGVTQFIVTDHGPLERRPAAFVDPTSLAGRAGIRLRQFGEGSALFNRGGLVEVRTPRLPSRCFIPGWELVIDVEGHVILCCNDYLGENRFGNVTQSSLMQIWKGAEMSSLRARLARGQFERPICQACTARASSHMPERGTT